MAIKVGIIGARGYVSQELIGLLWNHPDFDLTVVSSRARKGERLQQYNPAIRTDMCYMDLGPEQVAEQELQAVVLAMPNGLAAPFVHAIEKADRDLCIIDLSADYRFDDSWVYGLPELNREKIAGAKRISNPGCYATAMQLAIAPMRDWISGPVQCFGVSGYSGAGTTASEKNDPDKLADNLMPYSLTGHVHEREVARHLELELEFMPHVAPHFRGLSITANMHLNSQGTLSEIEALYAHQYEDDGLIKVQSSVPWINKVAGRNGAIVGGFTLSEDGQRLVVVSVLDNLLKGAASQALQNMNLAFGFDELKGIRYA